MKKKLLSCFSVLVLGLMLCAAVTAESGARILNACTDGQQIILYVNAPENDIGNVYIGSEKCTGVKKSDMGGKRTIILLDNSRSINPNFRGPISTILKGLVDAGGEEDIFTLATFAEEITYLTRGSSDHEELYAAIDGITYRNQDSYLTNVLYRLVEAIGNDHGTAFTRVIVIADGADDELIGYTDSELTDELKRINVPVYMVGCNMNYNADGISRMLSFARASGGEGYIIGDTSTDGIVDGIESTSDCVKLTLTPPLTACDGSERPVRVNIGASSSTVTVKMPFVAIEAPAEPAPTPLPPTDIEKETAASLGKGTPGYSKYVEIFGRSFPMLWVLVAAGALLLLIAAAILIILLVKNKRRKAAAAVNSDAGALNAPLGEDEATIRGTLDGISAENAEKTVSLSGGTLVTLCLRDLNDPSKTFEMPIADRILIGKDPKKCQIVINYSKFVSSVHCEVIARLNMYTVRDGADGKPSTNGTFVNEQPASPELELPAGSVLRIGDVQFEVTYR